MEQPVFPPFLHVAANDFTRGVIDATKTIFETTFPSRFFGVPEGTIIFPGEPIVRVIAPIMEAQLLETALLNIIKHLNLNRKHTSQAQHMPKPR